MKAKQIFKTILPEIIFFLFALLFGFWLMNKTFGYNLQASKMLIASKAWSDFAANIPLIRSFSWGDNFPPEYPLFPGEPIKYHFLFYFLVGLLEKAGLTMNWALNLPSIIGFTALLCVIYFLTKLLFKKRAVAAFTVVFFLLNGSLSFLEFFRQHPLSLKTPYTIITNQTFPSFGPYDGKIVSAFWNLNIFTNQRHLALAYFFALLIVYLLIRFLNTRQNLQFWQAALIGVGLGLTPFFHKAVLLMTVIILSLFFLLFPKLRRSIIIIFGVSGVLALPQILYQISGAGSSFSFNPGYLISRPLTLSRFSSYWFLNLGLSTLLIPLGVALSNRQNQKIFLSFFSLFAVGNLFQFSPEIAANHKFFNLFLIAGNMFSAWAIYQLWTKSLLTKLAVPFLIFFLTFSGIIDFFPIRNDSFIEVLDAPRNPDILWIRQNTPKKAVFLNSSYIYSAPSLAGRKIFLGWPYFPWSLGYNTHERDETRKQVLEATTINKDFVCDFLADSKIQFVSISQKKDNDGLLPNYSFWENNFSKVYENPKTGLLIYDARQKCQ